MQLQRTVPLKKLELHAITADSPFKETISHLNIIIIYNPYIISLMHYRVENMKT